MLWWIKVSCLAVFYACVFLTPTPVNAETTVLIVLSFVPYMLFMVHDYVEGVRYDTRGLDRSE